MRSIRLITAQDEYDTAPGFILKGCQSFDSLIVDRNGDLTAHDVLEHQNGVAAMGPVWDELQAIGGIWYVRGQWGDFLQDRPSIHSPHSNVASDVTRMFPEWQGETYSGKTRPTLWDDDFTEILAIARADIPREWDESTESEIDAYLQFSLHHIRIGWRKAYNRFEKRGRFYAHQTYAAIKEAVKSSVRQIEWEGQEFILSYGNCEAQCRAVWE